MKGIKDYSAANVTIPSTVAQEFLLFRDLDTGKPRYFLPVSMPHSQRNLLPSSRKPTFRGIADQIHLDFNNEYPSVIEYSHRGIAQAINNFDTEIFGLATQHLPVAEARKLMDRFVFLAAMQARCLALRSVHVEAACRLMKKFLSGGQKLKDDFRNSLNDMLILAFALDAVSGGGTFETRDKLLAAFARPYFDTGTQHGDLIRFEQNPKPLVRRKSQESKGYINTGWRYQFH